MSKAAKKTAAELRRRCLLSMLAGALLMSCTGAPMESGPSRPNLLLITVDTLRADHLGSYGYDAIETPNLDRLATEGVRFEQAASVAPLTLPAHASILTGQYPFRHGVRDNLNFVLSEEALTIQEVLATAGYSTGGFVGAFVLRQETGIAQGFDAYTDFEPAAQEASLTVGYEVERPAGAVVEDASSWISERKGRFFGWVHLFDPHLPYAPPPPYDELYPGAPYDGEIAYVDEAVGTLLRALDEAGHSHDTLVAVVADHGEGLGQHGEQRHALLLYDETVRVPLLLWAPGVLPAGTTVTGQTSLVDLLPTLLGLLGIPDPEPGSRDGVDLRPLIADPSHAGSPAYAEAVTSKIELGWSELRAVRAEGYKYIAAPRPELYDLRSDPGETNDVLDAERGRAAALREQLEAWTATDDLTRLALGDSFVDPATVERLRSLGYLAGGAPARRPSTGTRQDPKDRVEDFEAFQDALRAAGRAVAAADWREAAKALEVMERRVPGHHLVHYYRGRTALLRGDAAGAVQDLERTLQLAPAHALAYTDLASAYQALGEKDRAIEILRSAVMSFPEDPNNPFLLGSLLHESGRLDEALAAYLLALRFDPSDPRLLRNLSHVYFSLQEYDAAAELLRQLVALEPAEPSYPFQLGLVDERRGDPELAAEWFRRALEVDPGFAAARQALARHELRSDRD